MISLEGVSKSFGSLELLKNVSFTIDSGERVSLIGPGGCGKTTVLKILLGLVSIDSGEAKLFERAMGRLTPNQTQELLKRVGMAFQQGGLFDFMTVAENLIFAMSNMTHMNDQQMDDTIEDLLASVKLSRTKDMYPYELSGGMKRRVGIARALCTNPQVAIFDEPTSGLDPVTSTIILNMIHELGGENPEAALLVATSNVEIAIRFAKRLIILHEGEIVADGDWRELLVEGSDWVRNFLGIRLIGLDIEYAHELHLPQKFIDLHWNQSAG